MMKNTAPIGIFDSGIGGLTVVKKLLSFLPNESIIYFGDTARVPYGSKSDDTVIDYTRQDINFLISKNVKLIVAACNTASSVALDKLRKSYKIPIIGMIEPGAESALKRTKNGRIGVIGTYATVSKKAYSKEIHRRNREIEVFEKACPLFVPLAEEGWLKHKATYLIAEEYLAELRELRIDTLILGCTHYPLLSEVIQEVIGQGVSLIDSGTASSSFVKNELDKLAQHSPHAAKSFHEYYVSDLPAKFKHVSEQFLGQPIENLQKIELDYIISLNQ